MIRLIYWNMLHMAHENLQLTLASYEYMLPTYQLKLLIWPIGMWVLTQAGPKPDGFFCADMVKIQWVIPALRWHCTHAAKDHANPNEPMLLRAWNRRKIAKHDPVEASLRHPRLSQGGWPCASLRPLNGRQMELERPTETGHRQNLADMCYAHSH